jgi:hypothetical protein
MRFLLLIKHDERQWLAEPTAHREKIYEEYRSFLAELVLAGLLVEADQCTTTDTAQAVRLREGNTELQGVSRRGAEQIAGFILVDVASREDALRIATRIPTVRTGTVEVWPISPRQQTEAN